MTDRELLELAAKAAGMVIAWIGDVARDCTNQKKGAPMYRAPMWNPLADDGDAFRLAVKLDLQTSITDFDGKRVVIHRTDIINEFGLSWPCTIARVAEPVGDDQYAATRRAITRAAAEIGKAMP